MISTLDGDDGNIEPVTCPRRDLDPAIRCRATRQIHGDLARVECTASPAYCAIGSRIIGDAGQPVIWLVADEYGHIRSVFTGTVIRLFAHQVLVGQVPRKLTAQ